MKSDTSDESDDDSVDIAKSRDSRCDQTDRPRKNRMPQKSCKSSTDCKTTSVSKRRVLNYEVDDVFTKRKSECDDDTIQDEII